MRSPFPFAYLLVLPLACGDKGDTTNATDDTIGAQTSDQTGPATTGATTGPATTGPTTGASTGAGTGSSTTQTTDQCGGFDSCGIEVEMSGAVCDPGDGLQQASTGGVEPPSLTATHLDADRVAVKETGYEATCCLMLTPELVIDQQTITVTYGESGDPCDCICNYTIDYVLRKVPSGTWTIVSGALSTDVTVP